MRARADRRARRESFAYGNSASDLPHLQLVRHGMLVNGSLAARREAAALGVRLRRLGLKIR